MASSDRSGPELRERLCMTLCSLTPVVFHFHWLVQSKHHSSSMAPRVDDISFGKSSFFLVWQCNRDMCLFALHACYARTGRSSRQEVSLSGVGSGLSALATCDADMW